VTDLLEGGEPLRSTVVLSAEQFCCWLAELLEMPAESFQSEAGLPDIGLDSFALLEVFLAFMEAGVEIEETDFARVRTVGDLYQVFLVKSALRGSAGFDSRG
jgi:acyl carrier protein